MGQESCQGHRVDFFCWEEEVCLQGELQKGQPSAALAAFQSPPCSGKMAARPGHSLADGCHSPSTLADFLKVGRGGRCCRRDSWRLGLSVPTVSGLGQRR